MSLAPRLRVGLTGGIGSGKSTVAALFAERGARIVDADAIARALTAPGGAAIEALRAAFGDAAIDGSGALDRDAMRRRAFADPDAKSRLERLLHPLIRAAMREQIEAPGNAAYVVVEIPLLAERSSARDGLDRILVVDCPRALQIERAVARSALAREEVEAIIAQQAPRRQRLDLADDVIVNAGDRSALAARVDRLDAFYRTLPGGVR